MNAYAGVSGSCFLVMVFFFFPSIIINVCSAGMIGIVFGSNPLIFFTFVFVILMRTLDQLERDTEREGTWTNAMANCPEI